MAYIITSTPPALPSNVNPFFNTYGNYQFSIARPTITSGGSNEALFLVPMRDYIVRVYYNCYRNFSFANNSQPLRVVGLAIDYDVSSGDWVYSDFHLSESASWLSNPSLQFFDYFPAFRNDFSGSKCYYLRNNTPYNLNCLRYEGISYNSESEVYFGIISCIAAVLLFYLAFRFILRPFYRRISRCH